MASGSRDDPLAYGYYHPRRTPAEAEPENQDGERGLLGGAYQKLRDRYQPQRPGSGTATANRPQGDDSQSNPSTSTVSGDSSQPSSGLLGSSIFNKIHGVVHELGAGVTERLTGGNSAAPSGSHLEHQTQDSSLHRFGSFARPKGGVDVKWYVDGCEYMWAVSRALEQARETIWILDCESTPLISSHRLESLDNMPTHNYVQ
jgi:phospholipase D1/2